MKDDVVCCNERYHGKCPVHGVSEWCFDNAKKRLAALEAENAKLKEAQARMPLPTAPSGTAKVKP